MFENFLNILIAPKKAFPLIKEKPSWFLPWLLISVLAASVQFGFYSLVDAEYLLDQLVQQSLLPGMGTNDLRVILQPVVDNKKILAISSAIGVPVGLLVLFLSNSIYFAFISKFTDDNVGFKRWFALSAWCTVPTVFSALGGWLVIITSGGLIDMNALNPFSFNFLFKTEGTFTGLFSFVNVITLWTLSLLILGYKNFTSSSTLKAALVVVLPYLLIFAIWALVLLL
ncbi:YIP1 family protein [Haliea sp. AH-315-K21]|uniref:Yip1 domain-containing protein n=1 Tax=SAR86 cluster bacterium TaxID=2030880 RepID=A0A2A5CA80_9GAMM|nr:YIP1 family protein [Haliea sp. AH-315-K21]PCJ40350.1 MAG: hypothetical protein COA71_10845 [SAR86 cluster bacterium]